ncbi:hypothetical protein GGI42DRAFT_35753 [Trichoderma sp. SZMC 28013]
MVIRHQYSSLIQVKTATNPPRNIPPPMQAIRTKKICFSLARVHAHWHLKRETRPPLRMSSKTDTSLAWGAAEFVGTPQAMVRRPRPAKEAASLVSVGIRAMWRAILKFLNVFFFLLWSCFPRADKVCTTKRPLFFCFYLFLYFVFISFSFSFSANDSRVHKTEGCSRYKSCCC